MKSKETINIDVNIYGTRFSVVVPFSDQDAVRATEAQMKAYLMKLRNQHSTRTIAECMAMMAYHYASNFFAVKAQLEKDTEEAEDLLRDLSRQLGDEDTEDPETLGRGEYGEF